MKTKLFVVSLLIGMLYFACEDGALDSIGMGMRPDQDNVNVYDTIIQINGETVKLDSIYAKSMYGYLGKFYDTEFGEIKTGYVCQFYPTIPFMRDSMVRKGKEGREIDSIKIDLDYYTYVGDSLAPMEVTAYPVNRALPKDYYTTLDPRDFVDMTHPLGKLAYTSRNLNISDSLNNVIHSQQLYKQISIPLPREFGQELFELFEKDSAAFMDVNGFLDIFPGAYFESTYGTGNIVSVERSRISIYYTREYTEVDSTGKATVSEAASMAAFVSTKEVLQLSSLQSNYDEHLLQPKADTMFLKTPAGVYSKLTIPVPEIVRNMGSRKFNNAKLVIEAYPQSDWEHALPFPGSGVVTSFNGTYTNPKLLLLPQDSVKNFFENQSVADRQYSYSTSYSESNNSYTFSNIATLIQHAISDAPEKDLELLLIPIQAACYPVTTGYYSSTTTYVDYASYHYLLPSAVALMKGGSDLQINLIASDLEVNQ